MNPAPRRALARVVPAAALLLVATACSNDSSSSSSSPSEPASPQVSTAAAATTSPGRTTAMNIRLTLNGHHVAATLNDSPTARDFAAQLPLTLSLRDFNQAEKIADLPRKLSTSGAPEGADQEVGDLAYYAPWNQLATYYRDAPYAAGLVPLGHMADGGAEQLATADEITIEAAP
ncbi:cyclophilin-like fold protein [Streptomyces stelliscabiei]|nr:cyclophilin-like fold protein [Streptomyces sp. Root264]MCX5268696.1 cyclophilin-like fold protein [Streptomyces sp. NBC_00199]MDX2554213.1 cyclophilin-like fold protein [Streptomyces stelliscabiei]MDX2609890.1 cyclophilin-like fold protein [Streptomyces stelliscabiei]MDX2638753.1 cyclophilin-like fold protein [Streptomyces stelliscabiei]MDX2661906.1 cyclophilin-like fold protein [Streptomyces stelliscabiei]